MLVQQDHGLPGVVGYIEKPFVGGRAAGNCNIKFQLAEQRPTATETSQRPLHL
jgi:hypothetical protein